MHVLDQPPPAPRGPAPRALLQLMMMPALLAAVATPGLAQAGGIVAVTDSRVPQYREALQAARAEMPPSGAELDVAFPEASARLRQMRPEVGLAIGQKALEFFRVNLPELPVVFAMVFEKNAAAAGPSATGVVLDLEPAGQLARLKRVYPGLKRLGVLFDPRVTDALAQTAAREGPDSGVQVTLKPVAEAKEVQPALAQLAGSVDAVWLLPDPKLITKDVFSYLLAFTLERKIALFGFLDSFTQAGALASIAPEYADIGREAGRLAAQLLAKPADKRLPMPAPRRTRGALSVNPRIAQRLGVEVPASAIQSAQHVHN